MKPPHLLASFAVAATAAAADLKDHAQAAREFNEATKPTLPLVGPWGPIPRDKIYDAPNYRVPEVLPDNMPPGRKEWKYGGGTYYLLPLIPAREK
jgi:hypothetical protein